MVFCVHRKRYSNFVILHSERPERFTSIAQLIAAVAMAYDPCLLDPLDVMYSSECCCWVCGMCTVQCAVACIIMYGAMWCIGQCFCRYYVLLYRSWLYDDAPLRWLAKLNASINILCVRQTTVESLDDDESGITGECKRERTTPKVHCPNEWWERVFQVKSTIRTECPCDVAIAMGVCVCCHFSPWCMVRVPILCGPSDRHIAEAQQQKWSAGCSLVLTAARALPFSLLCSFFSLSQTNSVHSENVVERNASACMDHKIDALTINPFAAASFSLNLRVTSDERSMYPRSHPRQNRTKWIGWLAGWLCAWMVPNDVTLAVRPHLCSALSYIYRNASYLTDRAEIKRQTHSAHSPKYQYVPYGVRYSRFKRIWRYCFRSYTLFRFPGTILAMTNIRIV